MDLFINYIVVGFKPENGGTWSQVWILLLGLSGLGFCIERFIYLFFTAGNTKDFMSSLQRFVKTSDWDKAQKFAESKPNMPLAKAVAAIIKNRDAGSKKVQKAIDEVFLSDAPNVTKNISIISMFANTATMVGLMGTIFGLMMSFDAVANAPAAQRATELAKGISIAMSTTLFGLTNAIPLILIQGALAGKADKVLADLDEKTSKLVNLIEA
ncbi:MAG: MotA/TolQ/ExbB proton channel family protein [Chitinispirillales bacterium]|jgi:biopolymer transport protein ExbB/TolQ|nr:MotA/TolQ/ExbB proton channel family protein [Chitinispirillales bacterium]